MDEEPLVRAMPRRLLYQLNGFITRLDLAVLTSLDEESWYATRTAIAADVDCKEVRLAVVVVRKHRFQSDALVAGNQVLAHSCDIGPEINGLAALKSLAKRHAETVCGATVRGVEIAGYLNDDHEPSLRRVLVVVYRALVEGEIPAPEGMAWIATGRVGSAKLDPLSLRVASAVGG